jgi:large subunit ribosomal protein L23
MAETTTKAGLQLEPHQVVLRPLVTEKGTHQSDRYNSYAFEVHPQATKFDVKRAVESLFNVRVLRVHTQVRKGKPRRYRSRFAYQRDWKKAIVTLHDEDRISFF